MYFTVAIKTANYWKPPETNQNHLQAPKTILPKTSAITLNQPSLLETTHNQPEST